MGEGNVRLRYQLGMMTVICYLLVKNPPPAPGSLFLGVAIDTASVREGSGWTRISDE